MIFDSYKHVIDVTPADADLDPETATNAIYVGVAGDLAVRMKNGTTGAVIDIVFANLPVGIHKLSVTRINSTGTAATDIVALW